MMRDEIDRRQFLAASLPVVVPFPGLQHVQAKRDTFVIPHHAWQAVLAAAIVTRRFSLIDCKVSADSAVVLAGVIECREHLSCYADLYYGCFEPTPERDAGRKWLTDDRSVQRLERLCVFLRVGGFGVEDGDTWVVLHREASHAQ